MFRDITLIILPFTKSLIFKFLESNVIPNVIKPVKSTPLSNSEPVFTELQEVTKVNVKLNTINLIVVLIITIIN